jgi:SAM-dependent methyltransferase
MSAPNFLEGRDYPLVDRPQAEFWWHSSPLPDGTRTKSRQEFQETQFRIWDGIMAGAPEGFAARRVLDVGAADGFFSLAAWAAGAASVTAIDADYIGWPDNLTFLTKAWNADIEIVTGDFRTQDFEAPFDTILLLGVLYHAPDVFGLIRRARPADHRRQVGHRNPDVAGHLNAVPAIRGVERHLSDRRAPGRRRDRQDRREQFPVPKSLGDLPPGAHVRLCVEQAN